MKKVIAVIAAGVMACVGLGSSAFAGQPTHTWFSFIGTSEGKVEAIANVCHAGQEDCGSPSGDIKFVLFKRKDGAWVKIASLVSNRDEGWIANLKAPRRGKCKMVARYLGDDAYDGSKAALKAQCNDEDWIR